MATAADRAPHFDAATHGCPHVLPSAPERLGWYFNRRNTPAETQRSRSFPGFLLMLFEEPCRSQEQCQNTHFGGSCTRTADAKDNTAWAMLDAVDEVFNAFELLETIVEEEYWPDRWRRKTAEEKGRDLRAMVTTMQQAGCYGSQPSGQGMHKTVRAGRHDVSKDVGYYVVEPADGTPPSAEVVSQATRVPDETRVTLHLRMRRMLSSNSKDWRDAKAVYTTLNLGQYVGKSPETQMDLSFVEVAKVIASLQQSFLPVDGKPQRMRRRKEDADNAVGSRAAASRGRGRGRGGRRGRASVGGRANQAGASRGTLLHSDGVNPARSPARSPHRRRLGSLQHATVHCGPSAVAELRSPAEIARGVEAMNELSNSELYREIAWGAASGVERPELQQQLKVIANTAELLAERRTARAGTVQADQADQNGSTDTRTASHTLVQQDLDADNGTAGVHTASRTIAEEDAGPLAASANGEDTNGEDTAASQALDASAKRRRTVH